MNYFVSDWCMRCCVPFLDGQFVYAVAGGPAAKYRDIAIEVCRDCLQAEEFDSIVAYVRPVYERNDAPWSPPIYYGNERVDGGTYLAELDNGMFRLPLHRGHVEWTRSQADWPSPSVEMVYSEHYDLYGPASLLGSTGVHRIVARTWLDLSKPNPSADGGLGFVHPAESREHSLSLLNDLRLHPLSIPGFSWEDIGNNAQSLYGREPLRGGDPIFVERPALDLILQAAETMPEDVPLAIGAFPSPGGFVCWVPPLSPLTTGGMYSWAGFTWRFTSETPEPTAPLDIAIVPFYNLAGLRFGGFFKWPVATTLGDVVRHFDQKGIPIFKRKFALLWSLFAFMEQEIVVSRPLDINRAARHRLRREGSEIEAMLGRTKVIVLRRIHHAVKTKESEPVQWNWRWWVRGHWRSQWFRSSGQHKAIWVQPYIKGPDDRPLKAFKTPLILVKR